MDKNRFNILLSIITTDILAKIVEKYSIDEDKAIKDFFKSELFALLEREETKMWQYSTPLMLELYDKELNGNFEIPEF